MRSNVVDAIAGKLNIFTCPPDKNLYIPTTPWNLPNFRAEDSADIDTT